MNKKNILAIAAAACCCAGSVHAGQAVSTRARAVSLSLDGSSDRYGASRSDELRAGLEFECASELKLGRSALGWNLELYYDYSRSQSDGSVTNANSSGVDLAKILLSRWRGTELETLKPYLLAGAEFTRLTEPDEEGKRTSSSFLSPAVGIGLELKLNSHASLNAEYRRNLAGGGRRVSGATLGISYALFGADDGDGGGKPAEERTPAGAI